MGDRTLRNAVAQSCLGSEISDQEDCVPGDDCVVIEHRVVRTTLELEVDVVSGTRRPIALIGEPIRTTYQQAFDRGARNRYREDFIGCGKRTVRPNSRQDDEDDGCLCSKSGAPEDVLTNWTEGETIRFSQPFTRASGLRVRLVGTVQKQMRKLKGICYEPEAVGQELLAFDGDGGEAATAKRPRRKKAGRT